MLNLLLIVIVVELAIIIWAHSEARNIIGRVMKFAGWLATLAVLELAALVVHAQYPSGIDLGLESVFTI